jgi:hypothetical protein
VAGVLDILGPASHVFEIVSANGNARSKNQRILRALPEKSP